MKAIVSFLGFTEESARSNGGAILYRDVIRRFSGPDCLTVLPLPWTADVKDLAAQLHIQGVKECAIHSYSHGQAAAVDFSRACQRLGIRVPLWLACDPVYRPPWLPRVNVAQPAAFRALFPGMAAIRVPAHIGRVVWCRQYHDIPRGHDLRAANHRKTIIEPAHILPYRHRDIDDSREWHQIVREELDQWKNPTA